MCSTDTCVEPDEAREADPRRSTDQLAEHAFVSEPCSIIGFPDPRSVKVAFPETSNPAAACAENGCERRAVRSGAVCRVRLVDFLRAEGEVIPFKDEDPELAGVFASAIWFVRTAMDDLPEEISNSDGPGWAMDIYAFLDPEEEHWKLAHVGLDMLGTHLSDTPPFGGMRLKAPMRYHRCRCLECGHETSMRSQLERIKAGELDPPCPRCGGIQRSATIAFGQSLDPDVLRQARLASAKCDLFLAVGTSLQVAPAGHLPEIALKGGARLVIVNGEPTPYDHPADAVIRGEISEVLPGIIGSRVAPPS